MSVSSRRRISRSLSLTVRMVLVALLTPLITVGLVIAVIVWLPHSLLLGVIIAITLGVSIEIGRHTVRRPPPEPALTEAEDPELFGLVDRLCALADIERPEMIVPDRSEPNSWVVHFPGRRPRLYLTSGLRELLSPDELRAVVAHELSHIANRDAVVMTVVGTPGLVLSTGRAGGIGGLLLALIGLLSQVGVRSLSRYRELAADAGSAAITGRPSALASALLKVSSSLERIPSKDLRATAALNAFTLVAVARHPLGRHR